LKENNFIKNKYFYQYRETEKGKFHTGKLNKSQQQEFQEFMKSYQDLFTWEPNDFGRTFVILEVRSEIWSIRISGDPFEIDQIRIDPFVSLI